MDLVDAFLSSIETADRDMKVFPNEFAYKKVVLDTYGQNNDNNAFYEIFATCKYDENWEMFSQWVNCKDNSLLAAFLKLRDDIGEEFFNEIQKSNYLVGKRTKRKSTAEESKNGNEDYFESKISQVIIYAILNFCKEYGYPFTLEPIKSQKPPRYKKLASIAPDNYTRFNVLHFLYELDELYGAACLVHKALATQEDDLGVFQNIMVSRVIDSPKTAVMTQTFPQSEIDDLIDAYSAKLNPSNMSAKEISEAKERIGNIRERLLASETKYEKFYLPMEFDALSSLSEKECVVRFLQKFRERNYQYSFEFDNGIFLELRADNLFDAAFYQLAQMLILPGRQVKLCPICKNYFKPDNPRQKYCKTLNRIGKRTCYPEKMFKRKNYIRKIAVE